MDSLLFLEQWKETELSLERHMTRNPSNFKDHINGYFIVPVIEHSLPSERNEAKPTCVARFAFQVQISSIDSPKLIILLPIMAGIFHRKSL